MGGTNPHEIRRLMNAGVRVRQWDSLHAKVYLFDGCAILGSSNASANGLAMEGREQSGWLEANILIDEPHLYKTISKWFDNLPARKIGDGDLEKAFEMWSRRRRINPLPKKRPGATLVEAIKSNSAAFRDRRIYICAYLNYELSPDGKARLKAQNDGLAENQREQSASAKLDAFEDWPELPDDATLVCFYVGPRGGTEFQGFREMPMQRQEEKWNNKSLQYCFEVDEIQTFSEKKVGASAAWRKALVRFKHDWKSPDGAFMDLGQFAQKYLAE
jgi:hypothetical protein